MKHSRKGEELEVLVTKKTNLCKSDKHFDIDMSKDVVSKSVNSNIVLGKLKETPCVNVTVKAIQMEEVEEVPGGKKVQSIIVADSTGTVRLTVWESEMGRLKLAKVTSLLAW